MNRDEFVEWFNGLNLIQTSLPDDEEYFPNFNDEVILALEEFKVHPVKKEWANGILLRRHVFEDDKGDIFGIEIIERVESELNLPDNWKLEADKMKAVVTIEFVLEC